MNLKLRVGVIGCTKATESLITALVKNKGVDFVCLITLDPSVSQRKARFVKIESANFEKPFEVISVTNLHEIPLAEKLSSWDLDVLVEIGWSHRIPKSILETPKFGTVGIHNSLLPAYQGGASLNWALIKDCSTWGCTLFHLEEDIDAGEIIFQEAFEITDGDDINTLFSKCDDLGIKMIERFLPLANENLAPRIRQDPLLVSKTPKRTPKDSAIDWHLDSRSIFNLVRALKRPYPRAFTFFRGKRVLINQAMVTDGKESKPGTITEIRRSGIVVSSGRGSILLMESEHEDGKPFIPKIGDSFYA